MGYILGISAFYHDSAAALLRDGQIIAAAQEERFTRKKHDPAFPARAVEYCLRQAGIKITDVSEVVFYEKPFLKFERLLTTYLTFAPRGWSTFLKAMPLWLKEKLFAKSVMRKELAQLCGVDVKSIPKIQFAEHHQSHAASAFYPSPYEEALILCMDGMGEWATTSAWYGKGNLLQPLWEIRFPHSLGMLYSAFTAHCGFKVNSGEYKLMGLAPYGEPRFVQKILENLIDIKDDGTFRLNMDYFDYPTAMRMTSRKFEDLFEGPARKAEGPLTQREMDLARSIQVVTEDIVLKIARTLHREKPVKNLCLAGGVALNCVANGRILREGPFENVWVQPAAGDAGGALGAALLSYYAKGNSRKVDAGDSMSGAYLGPEFEGSEIAEFLKRVKAPFTRLSDGQLTDTVAGLIADQNVIGWFQGRMEYGPRALGNRSILGDPRNPKMQETMNLKIKFRESFRPFAPSVLREHASEFFQIQDAVSPYMLITVPVNDGIRDTKENVSSLHGFDRLNETKRSTIPAVTHVDYSARVQTVEARTNPRYHSLLSKFYEKTGCPLVINTSFNVRGEPIVCTPEEAYNCFMSTHIDYLVLGDYLLSKTEQPQSALKAPQFELD